MKLLFSESRKPDECPLSYLIRLSEYNGFRSSSKLLFYAGLKWKNNRLPTHTMLTGEFDLNSLLAELSIKPIGETQISNFCKLFRTKIDTPRILSKHPKICPVCIREMGYAKESWNLLPVTCCTKHKIMLIDKDNKNRMLSWYRPYLAFYDTQHKIELEVNAPPKLVELSRIFERLLKKPTECKGGPQILKGLSPNECLSLLNFIAHFQAKIDGNSLLDSVDNLTISSQYENAFATLKNWPADFHSMLSAFINKPMTKLESVGIRKHFRTLHDQLYLQRENKGILRIKEEFENYLQEKWPTVLNPKRLKRISIDLKKKQYLSITEVEQILSCRIPKIQHLVESGFLHEQTFKGKKYYKRNEVERYLKITTKNWSFSTGCKELCISKHKLIQLLRCQIIPVIFEPTATNRDWLINKKGTVKLMEDLRNNASNQHTSSKRHTLDGWLKTGFTFEQTVRLMLDNKIKYRFLEQKNTPHSFKQFSDFSLY